MAIIIVCCQSDNEVIDLVVQDEFISIQTVEESDALKYATKILNNGARTKNNIILPSLDGKSLTYKSIVGSNVTLPVFNTNTDSNVLSEFFLIKENNEIKGYYSFFYASKSEDEINKGTNILVILNEDGEFVNGFRLRGGVFVSRFVGSLSSPKSKSQRVVELESCDEFYYTCGVQGIDEIILTSSGSGSAINNGSVTIFTFPPRGGGISIGVNNGDVEVPLGGSSVNSHYNPGGSSAGEPLFPCGDSLHGCEKMKCEDGSNQDYYGNCEEVENIIYTENLRSKPCHKNIIEVAIGLSSPLTTLINRTFEVNSETNLTLDSSDDVSGNAATRPTFLYNTSTRTCDVKIKFRESYLTTTTNLSLARTAIHESLHAVLVYMHEDGHLVNDDGTPLEGYADLVEAYSEYRAGLDVDLNITHHEAMSEFVSSIATSVSEYGRGIGLDESFTYYEKLSWAGLTETESFKNLYPKYLVPDDETDNPDNVNTEWLDIINTIAVEQDNSSLEFHHPDGTIYSYESKGNNINTTEPCD